MFVNDLFEGDDKDPCWKGYRQYGMKEKNGKEVPNCVPEGQTTNEVEQRFGEPLTGWHIVYRSSGNPVHGTPSFESKDDAQKYLMTKMFAKHHEFKVVHTAHVGVSESDPSGLLAASELNKSFIITAELAEGGKKKFRVRAQSERVAREKFSKHHGMAKILSVKEEGVSEAGLKFHGGFPDVDHILGPVVRDHDFATDNVRVKDKAEWERAVNSINARVFDDESEFISSGGRGKKVVGNGAVWAIWNDEKQAGWFNAKGRPLKTGSVGEAKKSSRDEKDVAAIRAVIQRLESELASKPDAPEDWKQDLEYRIASEKKRLGLYGLEESSADSKIASLEKKRQALQNQLELARERRKMRGQRIQSPAETKLSSKISDLGQQIHMLKQGVSEGAPELLKAEMPLVRHIERELAQHGYEKGTDEYNTMFKHAIAYYRQFGNVDLIKKQGVAEGHADHQPQRLEEKAYINPKIADHLANKGFTRLGSGVDQMAFMTPNNQMVLKIFGSSKSKSKKAKTEFSKSQLMFFEWVDYCTQNSNNPFLPRFITGKGGQSWATFEFEGQQYLQIWQERLYKLDSQTANEFEFLGMLVRDAEDLNLGDLTNKDILLSKDFDNEDIAGIRKCVRQLTTKFGLKNFQLLFKTMKDLYNIAKDNGWMFDQHSDNFMRRQDGTPVIIDPWATREQ